MMVLDNKFDRGQTVYLLTDKDQLPRIVYGYEVSGEQNEIIYKLACGTQISNHYSFEISTEIDVLLKTNV